MGMFNASLELDKPAPIQEDIDMAEPNLVPSQSQGKIMIEPHHENTCLRWFKTG